MSWLDILKSNLTENQLKELFNKNTREIKIMKEIHKKLEERSITFSFSGPGKGPYLFISDLPKKFLDKFTKSLKPFENRIKNDKEKSKFEGLSRKQQLNVLLSYVQKPIKELGKYIEREDLEKFHLKSLINSDYKGENKEEILQELEDVFSETGKFFTEEAIAQKDKEREEATGLSEKLKRKERNKRREGRKVSTSSSRIDSFEETYPESAQMFREWLKTQKETTVLNELLSLVGSPSAGDIKTVGRLKKFISEKNLSEENKRDLTAIANKMNSELTAKPTSNASISPNAIEITAKGLRVGQASKLGKTVLNITYGDDRTQKFERRQKDFLSRFEKLDLTNEAWYNNTRTREIYEYWVEKTSFKGSSKKFVELSEKDKIKYINEIRENIPDYPTDPNASATLYSRVFKDKSGYIMDDSRKEEDFAYFAQGIRDGLTGGQSSRKAFDFNTLRRFNQITLPAIINAVKKGVFITTDREGNQKIETRLGPVISREMNKLDKTSEGKREIISVLYDVVKGKSLSKKYQGSDKEVLGKIESNIRDQVKEKVPNESGRSIMYFLVKTFLQIYKKEGILSGLLNNDDLINIEYLTTSEVPKKMGENIQTIPKEEVKKSLDNLLVVLGEEDEIIIKEDVGLILESLDKKQKKKVKAILNIADPTEYFGHDFLKLSELIRLLKTLGVVKGDKKLNKKIIRYDDENVKVVKLAARLRKDYERLYNDLREMVYPKSGE